MLQQETDRANLVIDDLERLRLITFRDATRTIKLEGRDAQSVMKYVSDIEKAQRDRKGAYHFSDYGLAFIRTVGTKSPANDSQPDDQT